MKKLLIIITIIIVLIFGYNKYQDYQRFNGPETNYTLSNKIDMNYHDKNILINYQNAIAQLNGFTNTQWSAHRIDVLSPEKENKQTQYAVSNYAQKLAQVKHYESILEQSTLLKEKGLSNKNIQHFEATGLSQKEHKKEQHNQIIRNSFIDSNNYTKGKDPLIFEVQKILVKNGFPVLVDGIFKEETSDGLKAFEKKHNLLPDGKLDAISLEYLLESN